MKPLARVLAKGFVYLWSSFFSEVPFLRREVFPCELLWCLGALQGHRARKGVFITTSSFSADALEFASRIDSKIVLIDGPALAKYMIDHNVGVSLARSYDIKKIDSDYFSEE